MNFALLIPTYNFNSGIARTFSRLKRWREVNALKCAVYFIDDGSTDGTWQTLQSLQGQVDWCTALSHPANKGKGASIRTGFEAAKHKHDFVVMMDCDLHYGLDVVTERLLPELAYNDIVILDRSWTKEARQGIFLRQLASGLFNRLVAILTGVTYKDTQAGLKGFRVRSCAPLFSLLTLNGFSLDVEILSIALFYRIRIVQLPIAFDDPGMLPKHSTINLLKSPWLMLYDLMRINLNWKLGRYEDPKLRQRVSGKLYRINSFDKPSTLSSSAKATSEPKETITRD